MGTVLFWSVLLCYVAKLAHGEQNPYLEALHARPWTNLQGYVEVRPGAFMFYWLYFADGTTVDADRKPLIVWVQGGPGFAATGLANFAEIGPLNMDMKPRNHTWVKGRNVLLIDHPVGAGFSYVTDSSLLVKTDRDIAIDLSRAIKAFYRRHKQFRKTPTYIIGQSYGAKICPRLAFYLHTAIQKKRLKMNLKGIGIGSGWVDPKESTLVYPEYLYNLGVIDQQTYLKGLSKAKEMAHYMDKKDYVTAGAMHDSVITTISREAGMNINFNNINQPEPYPALEELQIKVNKYVKPTLSPLVNQSLEWRFMAEEVWSSLNQSFVVPSNKFLEMLLNTTDIKIAVYNGNMDVVTPIAGACNWVHKLKWPGAKEFKNKIRNKIRGEKKGFYKTTKQLSFWWVFASGHWVPEDSPEAMEQILEHLMSEQYF